MAGNGRTVIKEVVTVTTIVGEEVQGVVVILLLVELL